MRFHNHRDRLKRRKHHLKYPQELTLVEGETFDEIPDADIKNPPLRQWVSRQFLVQEFKAGTQDYPDLIRLSINRVQQTQGNWVDGITWDELMECKRQVGYGNHYAIEVYPEDEAVVNVANIRHLYIFQTPLKIGFKHEQK